MARPSRPVIGTALLLAGAWLLTRHLAFVATPAPTVPRARPGRLGGAALRACGRGEPDAGSAEAFREELQKVQDAPARRDVLAGLAAGAALSWAPSARAAVGEGDMLPNGAKQEDRIRKGSIAWKELGEKLTTTTEVSKEEWDNTQGFLRRLYSLNDDMTYLARGFRGEKKETSEKLINDFKKRVKEADKPAKAKDLPKFMDYHKEISQYLVTFTGMLADVTADLSVDGMEDVEIVPIS